MHWVSSRFFVYFSFSANVICCCRLLFNLKIEFVERKCTINGEWEVRPGTTRLQYPNGWTNFTPCYTREMIHLINKLYAGGNHEGNVRT